MANPLRLIDFEEPEDPSPKPEERSTSHLASGHLRLVEFETEDGPGQSDTTDYLVLLTTQPDLTSTLNDEPPAPAPQPSGMVEHAAPPRMRPTVSSRVTTGFRRAVLFAALGGVAVGSLAAGAYLVATTPWVQTLLTPTAPAPEQPESPGDSVSAKPNSGVPMDSASDPLRDKGTQEYRTGNYGASIETLESAVNMYGGDPITYYQLGLAYMAAQGRDHALEDAEMAFRTAISLQPDWAAPHRLLAESLLRRDLYNDAIIEAAEATRLDPTQYDAWMTLGRAYHGAGKETEARDAFAQAARQAPPPPNNP
jgi:cytochrome c-type biogenesis protein CcmH/NrfG